MDRDLGVRIGNYSTLFGLMSLREGFCGVCCDVGMGKPRVWWRHSTWYFD